MMNTQSKATQKWQAKAGYITKGLKLKRDLAERFAEACEMRGESQAGAVSRFMEQYINETCKTLKTGDNEVAGGIQE